MPDFAQLVQALGDGVIVCDVAGNITFWNAAATRIFGFTAATDHWSSTTLADNTTYAWGVFFGTGEVSYGLKTLGNSVRGVRGGL